MSEDYRVQYRITAGGRWLDDAAFETAREAITYALDSAEHVLYVQFRVRYDGSTLAKIKPLRGLL